MTGSLRFLRRPSGRLAYRARTGSAPTLLFLPGYASDMDGAKAVALDDFAARQGLACVRFDYSGTGSSDGRFEDGTLQSWIEDSLATLDEATHGPVVVVGSSMGGWIGLHLAMRRPERVRALVGIAAAPDFTEWGFTADQKQALQRDGRLVRDNPYGGEGQLTTLAFWNSAQQYKLLDAAIEVGCPVRLVHGESDSDVPPEIALGLMPRLRSADVQLKLIKGGGHRLSEPHEIEAILRTVEELVERSR